jgi:hypothetical protein
MFDWVMFHFFCSNMCAFRELVPYWMGYLALELVLLCLCMCIWVFVLRMFSSGIPNIMLMIWTQCSENVGLLGSTRIGSRRVIQISAGFMIFFSILGKINLYPGTHIGLDFSEIWTCHDCRKIRSTFCLHSFHNIRCHILCYVWYCW